MEGRLGLQVGASVGAEVRRLGDRLGARLQVHAGDMMAARTIVAADLKILGECSSDIIGIQGTIVFKGRRRTQSVVEPNFVYANLMKTLVNSLILGRRARGGVGSISVGGRIDGEGATPSEGVIGSTDINTEAYLRQSKKKKPT